MSDHPAPTPQPRGTASGAVVEALRTGDTAALAGVAAPTPSMDDDDLHLALWCCHELHYRGFADTPHDLEWSPDVIAFRRRLEDAFLTALRASVTVPPADCPVPELLAALVAADDGPSLSTFVRTQATRAQFEEFAVHRSVYHLKEADPHSFAIPRLSGRAKAALVEIQADEYGSGVAADMHSELFRSMLRGLGLDDRYGHYVDVVPGVTLAISNLISLFGLNRSLRGACAGHLAAFEMTSSLPNRCYGQGLKRLGGDAPARRFFEVHVTADALHEQLAAHDLCGSLVDDEPELAGDVLFGAAAGLYLDRLFTEYVLDRWAAGLSSLRPAGPVMAEASGA